MTPEEIDYVRYRMARAEETMQVAKLVFENGHLHDTVNRLYYACFYAVSALLFTEGLSSSRHTGIRSLFDRHWIKTGRLPVEMARFYRRLFKYRHEGDYARVTFNREHVQDWLEQAEAFIAETTKQIEEQLRKQHDEM